MVRNKGRYIPLILGFIVAILSFIVLLFVAFWYATRIYNELSGLDILESTRNALVASCIIGLAVWGYFYMIREW